MSSKRKSNTTDDKKKKKAENEEVVKIETKPVESNSDSSSSSDSSSGEKSPKKEAPEAKKGLKSALETSEEYVKNTLETSVFLQQRKKLSSLNPLSFSMRRKKTMFIMLTKTSWLR